MKKVAFLAQMLVVVFGLQFNLAVAQQIDSSHFTSECDRMLAGQFHADEPGATALIARDGVIIYEKAFGMANMELQVPMQVDQVFRIGSITKQFTAVAILQLMEKGKLSLQDDMTKFIPDYPTQGNKITIENLLTHTSGIQDYAKIKDTTKRGTIDFAPTEMIDYFKNRPVRFTPGTKWEYSNSNYFLLGYIIEVVTGEVYQDYLENHIVKPLGMSNSYYASDIKVIKNRADGYCKGAQGLENAEHLSMTQPYAAGAILSTVGDLFKWHQAVHSYKLITRESLNKALTRYTLSTGEKTNYGYGWRFGYIQDSPSIWHGGMINGFIAMEMYLPKEDVFVAVLSNCECNSPEDITAKLAALAIGEPYEYKVIAIEDNILASYTGVYENGKGQQRVITASEHQLSSQSGRGPKSKVNAFAQDRFVFDSDSMSKIEFARSDKGAVEKLVTKSRNGIEVWNKTNKPIPSSDGIELSEKILESYVGEYRVAPDFTFTVTKERKRLFVKATGQEAFEIFAESEAMFFLKVNDAQLEFVRDDLGIVTKAVLTQGGRTTEAKKVR
jgi:CubicO group peptidase (beta-lactamase class C family)